MNTPSRKPRDENMYPIKYSTAKGEMVKSYSVFLFLWKINNNIELFLCFLQEKPGKGVSPINLHFFFAPE